MRWLLHRVQLAVLIRKHDPIVVMAVFNLVTGSISIGIMAVLALVTHAPFLFPSLGATAFLLFSNPMAPVSCPRNTIVGNLVAAIAGWLSLVLFGLTAAPSTLTGGFDWPRVGAAAVSVGVAGALMVLLRVPHPPAGAAALLVSLGLLPHLWQIGVLMLAVIVLTLQAIAINRLAGINYPLWAPPGRNAVGPGTGFLP